MMSVAPTLTSLRRWATAAVLLYAGSTGIAARGQQETFAGEERAEHGEHAEAHKPGCFSTEREVVTDRPTISSGTETTQCGVLEVLSGPERFWLGRGAHQDDIAPSLQFGLTPKLDLHYTRATFFQLGGNPGPLSGAGDTFAGVRYRFNQQSRLAPSFAAFYNLKVPTGSPSDGFGTGRYDHALALLVSEDLPKAFHVDFNVVPQLIGRPASSGFDKNVQLLLIGYLPPWHRVTVGAGSYGSTTLNADTPAYAMSMLALDWHVRPSLILDAGWDEGLTSAAPRKRITFGFSYAVANLYALFARPKGRAQ